MIPTDLASCIAWHEASYEAGADGTFPSFLFGVGGLPDGPTQTDAAKRPMLDTVGGHRVYTFDNVDDVLKTAGVVNAAHTIVVFYASRTTAVGKRVLCNFGGSNWLMGPRSETGGKFSLYNGAFIGGPAVDTAFHVHSSAYDGASTTLYRCDALDQGSNVRSPNHPSRVTIGGTDSGYPTETANAHVMGIAIFNARLDTDTELFPIEEHFYGAFPSSPKRMTQVVSEVAYEAGSIRETQLLAEMSYEAGKIRSTQELIELTYEAGAIRFTQFLIELVHEPQPGLNWRDPRERPDFGHARRIRDVHRGAGHRWIDNPGRRA